MESSIIGRKNEIRILEDKLASPEAEFIAVYGRRRVGKTYLIKQFFSTKLGIFFEQTGLNKGSLSEQLALFTESLSKAFYRGAPMATPKTWMDALHQLNVALEGVPKNKRVTLFFDELPWLAGPKSGFLKALEHFWNTAWSYRKKLILIVCGSAASWMLENLIYAKGGLHNRITVRLPLMPFTLAETEIYLHYLGIKLNRHHILQLYMVMGGIPHYLKSLRKNFSATQNINTLCFQKGAVLYDEFEILFHSLYKEPEIYQKIIRLIAFKAKGIDRETLVKKSQLQDGGYFNNRLKSLEAGGFISEFLPVGHSRRGIHYRVVDEYTLFYIAWIEPFLNQVSGINANKHYWESVHKKPAWSVWAGYAFEAVCFKHLEAIKKALGLEYIPCFCSDWRYQSTGQEGAQIDLVFDRDDGCVTLCEIKYSENPFVMTKEYALELKRKEAIYKERTRTKKQIFWVLIAANGVKSNTNSENVITQVINFNELF